MQIALADLSSDFPDGLTVVDERRESHKQFQPGIGPFGEPNAVRAALSEMKAHHPERYTKAAIKRLPDLLVPQEWAVAFKLLRPFGDNGKHAEHWSENVLHPYPDNTSSLGDCLKLLATDLSERKAVVIFGFEHTPPRVALDPAIRGFELLASSIVGIRLSSRIEEFRTSLVHPVHQQLRVFGYEVLAYDAKE